MSVSIDTEADRKKEPEPYRPRSWRRYLWEFLLYFIRPIVICYILGYFGWQSVKSIAYAISSYERAVKKEEIKARNGSGGEGVRKGKQDKRKAKEVRP